jgi:hypothetical protein
MEEVEIMAYITSSDYNSTTGRDSSEATTERLLLASKLLDSRIGNYATWSTGYKIDNSSSTWYVKPAFYDPNLNYVGNSNIHKIKVTQAQKDAIKLWVAAMITELYNSSNNMAGSGSNVKLGRFSVNKGSSQNNPSQILPQSMGFHDSILIDSGIIARKVELR